MSIIRTKRTSNYSVIPNHIHECGLSWRAVGMLVYLLSKPDDWKVSVTQLINHTKQSGAPLGRDGVYSVLRELCSKGYVKKQDVRNESGVFTGTNYLVRDEPLTDNPLTAEPLTANPTLLSTDVLTSTEDNKTANEKDCLRKCDEQTVVQEWNQFAKQKGIPSIRQLSDTYKKKLQEGHKVYARFQSKAKAEVLSIDEFVKAYLEYLHDIITPHHLGDNKNKWKMTFDYAFSKTVVENALNSGVLKR